jgi:ABC-type transport system substrate-binding protein
VGLSRFDPHRASSSNDNTHLYLTYDRLIHTDAEGRAVPGLATEWAFSPDGLALDLTLRPGVTFHDGTPFDAAAVAAVKANIERARTVTGSAVRAELASIVGVDVTGPLQVRLNAVRTGEVDATVLPPDQVLEAQAAGVTVTPGRTNNFYYLQPNRARPPPTGSTTPAARLRRSSRSCRPTSSG